MQYHQIRKVALLPVLALTPMLALAGAAFAGEALPDRPGFGYVIQFSPGDAAAPLPVPEQQAMITRPGFGYTINFLPGDPADSLFPVGWAKQRALNNPPQG